MRKDGPTVMDPVSRWNSLGIDARIDILKKLPIMPRGIFFVKDMRWDQIRDGPYSDLMDGIIAEMKKDIRKIDVYLANKWESLPPIIKEEMLRKYATHTNATPDMDLFFIQHMLDNASYQRLEDDLLFKFNDRIYHELLKYWWDQKLDMQARKSVCARMGMDNYWALNSCNKTFDKLHKKVYEMFKDFRPDRRFLHLNADEQDYVFHALGLSDMDAARVRGWDPDDFSKFPGGSQASWDAAVDHVRGEPRVLFEQFIAERNAS